jgi:class 3 adenylate cyclase/predicted component of type VI protein secretion system
MANLQHQLDERTAERDALQRELADTREQQTATTEVLQVINSSPGDLAPVFEAMLDKALRLCEATFGLLLTWDGEQLHRAAFRGVPDELIEAIGQAQEPVPGGFADRLVRGEGVIAVADLLEAVETPIGPGAQVLVRFGARSCVGVALRRDEALLGAIVVYRREVRPFSNKQIALLQNFAAQAVIAMENARLLNELLDRTRDLQESLEYQTATSKVLQVISRSTFDLQPVLDTMIETAARLCAADSGNVLKREGDVYLWVSGFGLLPEYQKLMAVRVQEGYALGINRRSIAGRVTLEGGVVHVHDAACDPEYSQEIARLGAIRTVLGVPLLREGLPIGAIMLWRHRVEPFTERQIELVRTFADQAVIAMENARLLGELRQRTEEIAALNRGLEARVAAQVEELGRVGRLKRFLAPQLAELIVSQGDEKILESHRREIVVAFCDLRGYTAFTETAEPEEVLDFLREYHGVLGPLVSQFEGTLDQFSGDGIMVFFNDPVPIPDPAERAVKMAMAMREEAGKLIATWRRDGCELGFGAGIAQGYATLGQIGFSERSGYTAIGTVCNLAARLCAEAKDGQILVSSRVARAVEAVARLEDLGNLELKGLRRPVAAFNVVQSTSSAEARPHLSVVPRAPGV